MINIKAIGCGLAFAPYLLERLNSFIESGTIRPCVIKQAASGLILRAEQDLIIHFRNREVTLNEEEARHFHATVEFRREVFDITRTSNEVVLANITDTLLLSHPQSEIWLDRSVIPHLITVFESEKDDIANLLPEWLSISGGNGRLLLSDGRSGRWVLLGQDHMEELERRQSLLGCIEDRGGSEKLPTIQVKGIEVHLQSASRLQNTFEEFSLNGDFQPYEEVAQTYSLRVLRTNEGMKLTDGNLLVSMLAKEARKWAAIIETELDKLQAQELERGNLKTVFAKTDTGVWILQGGDEIWLSDETKLNLFNRPALKPFPGRLKTKIEKEFRLILDSVTGACIALNEQEFEVLRDFEIAVS
jgi:hypothetical protein